MITQDFTQSTQEIVPSADYTVPIGQQGVTFRKMLGMELKEKLKALVEERNWSRYDLLDRGIVSEVSRSTIDNWFRGKTKPDLASTLRIARAFGVPMEYLADDGMSVKPTRPSRLPKDEASVLRTYRNLKNTGVIDESRAITGLSLAASEDRRSPGSASMANGVDPQTGKPLGNKPGKRGAS